MHAKAIVLAPPSRAHTNLRRGRVSHGGLPEISRYNSTMTPIEQFFAISLFIQLAHSAEELSTGFHRKWYLFTMPFKTFLLFEIVFSAFWIAVLILSFPNKEFLQLLFLALMFANGVQHIVWWGVAKQYVPGLMTAPLHIAVFLIFYFSVLL
ncbi:MAG: HXXEE domain-containing protein [Patescibacteria group bacterium]